MHTSSIGSLAEEIAACFLLMRGYAVLERNYRFLRKEIDIIAETGGRLVFVEVKFRRSAIRGLPREAVDARKIRHIVFAARGYLSERRRESSRCRFDVIEVRLGRSGAALVVEHMAGAFDTEGR